MAMGTLLELRWLTSSAAPGLGRQVGRREGRWRSSCSTRWRGEVGRWQASTNTCATSRAGFPGVAAFTYKLMIVSRQLSWQRTAVLQ